MQNYTNLDTYEFLNQSMEIQALYNRMPENVRKNYKDLSKFTKEFLPKFTKNVKTKLEELKTVNKTEEKIQTKEEIQNQINQLTQQLQQQQQGAEENV